MPTLYERLQEQYGADEERKTTIGAGSTPITSSIFDDLEKEEVLDETAGDYGFWGSLVQHGLSSATMGLTEFTDIGRTERWEEKDTSERIGAALGEFAGMFVPFGVLGKGISKGVGLLGRKGTRQIFDQATETAAKAGAAAIGTKGSKQVIRRSIQKGIDDAGTTIFGTPKIFKHYHLGGEFAEQTTEMVGETVRKRLTKELVGVKDGGRIAETISKGFKEGIRDGKHINTLEKWIEHSSGIVGMAPGLKKNIARWAAMATSETFTLGVYSETAAMMHAGAHGENFGSKEFWNTLKHSAILGIAFPFVRGAFKGGGDVTISKGFSRLWSGFKAMDYKAMAATEGGGEKLRIFINNAIGGRAKSELAGFKYTLKNGKEFTGIANAETVSKLSAEDAAHVLDQMRSHTFTKGMVKWGGEWLNDLRQSGFRMLGGAFINNTHMIWDSEKGELSSAWKRIPPTEILTHILIGAFFTRTRGAWATAKQPTASMKDHYDFAHLLGLETSGFESHISFLTQREGLKTIGGGLSRDITAQTIYKTVGKSAAEARAKEAEINPETKAPRNQPIEFDATQERDLEKIQSIFTAMDMHARGGEVKDYVPADLRYLSKRKRANLINKLNKIELYRKPDGTPVFVKDVNFSDMQDVLHIRTGSSSLESYKTFFRTLSEKLVDKDGTQLWILNESGDKPIIPDFEYSGERSVKDIASIRDLMYRFEDLGLITVDKTNVVNLRDMESKNPELPDIVGEIINSTNERMINEINGPGVIDGSFSLFDSQNILMQHIRTGREVEALKILHDIDMSNTQNLTKSQKDTVLSLNAIFNIGDKFIGSMDQIVVVKDLATKEKILDNDLTDIQRGNLLQLRQLFSVLSIAKPKDTQQTKYITSEALNETVGKIKDLGLPLEGLRELDPALIQNWQDYKMNKIVGAYVAPEKAFIMRELINSGDIVENESQYFQISTATAKRQELLKQYEGDPDQIKKADQGSQMWQEILDLLGHADGHLIAADVITGRSLSTMGIDIHNTLESINVLHKMLPKVYATEILKPLQALYDELSIVDANNELDVSKSIIHNTVEEMKITLANIKKGEATSESLLPLLKRLKSKAFHEGMEEKELEQFNSVIKQLSNSIGKLQKNTQDAEELFIQEMDIAGERRSLQDYFQEMINQEVGGRVIVLEQLITLLNNSRGRGANRAATHFVLQELKKNLTNIARQDNRTDITELDELLVYYNRTRNIKALNKVFNAAIESSIHQVESTREYDPQLQEDATRFLQRSRRKIETYSLQSLGERYHLQGLLLNEPVDPQLVKFASESIINNNPDGFNKIIDFAKNRINIAKISEKNRIELLEEFETSGVLKLIDSLSGSTIRPIVSIKQKQLVFDSERVIKRGNRDIFLQIAKDNGIIQMYEADNTIIQDGKVKTISNADYRNIVGTIPFESKHLNDIKTTGAKLDETDIYKTVVPELNGTNSTVIYVSKGRPFIIKTDSHNLERIDKWFRKWVDDSVISIERSIEQAKIRSKIHTETAPTQEDIRLLTSMLNNLKRDTKKLYDDSTTESNVQQKMTALYWGEAFPNAVWARFSGEFRLKENDGSLTASSFEALLKQDLNIFKRLNLYEGGNLRRLERNSLEWQKNYLLNLAETKFTKDQIAADEILVTAAAVEARLRDGINMVTIADESIDPITGKSDSKFFLQDIVIDSYNADIARIKNTNPGQVEFLERARDNLLKDLEDGNVTSLNASNKNASSYIDESMARLLSIREGREFDPTKVNGWKPIIYHRDKTGKLVAVKTWLVYSPIKAQQMRDMNIQLVSTESAVKVLFGNSTRRAIISDGISYDSEINKVKPTSRDNYMNEIVNLVPDARNSDYVMNIPIESFSIGSSNKVETGVTATHSLATHQSRNGVKELIEYQRIFEILSKVEGMSEDLFFRAKAEIYTAFQKHREDQGGITEFGAQQKLVDALLAAHMRVDDPAVKEGIRRIFTNTTMDLLRKPQITNGNSTYLIHDEIYHADGSRKVLTNPIYTKIYKPTDIVETGIKDGANPVSRLMVRQGGIAKPHEWGEMPLNDINTVRLVARDNNVDMIFGLDRGKLVILNSFDTLRDIPNHVSDLYRDKNRPILPKFDNKVIGKDFQQILDMIKAEMKAGHIKNNKDLFNFLKDPYAYYTPPIFVTKTQWEKDIPAHLKGAKELIEKRTPRITTTEVAIPRKSTDVVPTAVEHILGAEYGNHTIVNDYDLAVIHQRDFDMDHLYSHNSMGFEMLKSALHTVGIQQDYREGARDPIDFSPFGETKLSPIMGGNLKANGVREASINMESKKMAMGTAISLNQPLTWLSQLEFAFKLPHELETVKMNFSLEGEGLRNATAIVERLGNYIQAGVDPWGGDLKLQKDMMGRVIDFLLFGDMPTNPEIISKEMYQWKPLFDFGEKNFTQSQVEVLRDIVKENINILKRSQGIFNDVYVDGAQNRITHWDINERVNELNALFGGSKNTYLYKRLMRRYSNKYDGNKKSNLQKALVEIFFNTFRGVRDSNFQNVAELHGQKKVQEIIDETVNNKLTLAPNDVVQFFLPGTKREDIQRMMQRSTGGYILDHLGNNKYFMDRDYTAYDKIGTYSDVMGWTTGLTEQLSLMRAEGLIDYGKIYDPSYDARLIELTDKLGPELKRLENNSVVYAEVQSRRNQLLSKIAEVKRYTGTKETEELISLNNRLYELDTAMKLLETNSVRLSEDLTTQFITDRKTRVYTPNKEPFSIINSDSAPHYVYKVSDRDYKPENLNNLVYGRDGENGIKLVGVIPPTQNKKSKPNYFNAAANTRYIVLKNPIIKHSFTEDQVQDAYAWEHATREGRPEEVIERRFVEDLMAEVANAQDIINMNHRLNKNKLKRGRTSVFNRELFGSEAAAQEQNAISLLMKAYGHGENTGPSIEFKEIETLDKHKVKHLALLLLAPKVSSRAVVQNRKELAPHLYVDQRVQNAVLRWMHEQGFLDVITDNIELKSIFVQQMKGGLTAREASIIQDHLDLYLGDKYHSNLKEQMGKAGDFIVSLLSDRFSIGSPEVSQLLNIQLGGIEVGNERVIIRDNLNEIVGKGNIIKQFGPKRLAKRRNNCR